MISWTFASFCSGPEKLSHLLKFQSQKTQGPGPSLEPSLISPLCYAPQLLPLFPAAPAMGLGGVPSAVGRLQGSDGRPSQAVAGGLGR